MEQTENIKLNLPELQENFKLDIWNENLKKIDNELKRTKEETSNEINKTKEEIAELPQQIFDIVHPIGEIYIQYPNQEEPNILYDNYSTWENITEQYANLFFRAEGDASGEFGELQEEGLPNITGEIWGATIEVINDKSGAFIDSSVYTTDDRAAGSRGSTLKAIFNAEKGETKLDGTLKTEEDYHVYGKSDHVTPINMSIRIWKRIK